ncbi:MAG: hypothetical protein HC837_02670 [Chloroflexaceae bacterium]|nr:hypothetical protein [Chloroflexaceae bacterium]
MAYHKSTSKSATPAIPTSRKQHVIALLTHPLLMLVTITLVGLGLRCFQLGANGYWHDEMITTFLARLPPGEIVQSVTISDSHPPLYHILVHGWLLLIGDDLLSLRFFSVLLSTLCILLTYVLGRQLFGVSGSGIALLAAALMAISPFQIFHGQQARMYPLLAVLVLVTTILFWQAWQRQRWFWWLGFGVSVGAGLYTHVFYFLSLPALTFWALYDSVVQRQLDWRRWIPLLGLQIVAALAFLPFLPNMLNLTRAVVRSFWVQPSTGFDWVFMLVSVSNHATIAHDPRLVTPFWYLIATFLPGVAALLLTLVYSLREARRKPAERSVWVLLHLLIWTPIGLATIISLTIRSILVDRGLIGLSAPLALMMAALFLRFRAHGAVQVLTVAFVLSNFASLGFAYAQARESTMIEMADYLVQQQQPGDAIAVSEWQSFDALVLAHPEATDAYLLPGLSDRQGLEARARIMRWQTPDHIAPIEAFAPDYQRVWFALTTYGDVPYHQQFTRGWLDAYGELVHEERFGSAVVYLYELTPP